MPKKSLPLWFRCFLLNGLILGGSFANGDDNGPIFITAPANGVDSTQTIQDQLNAAAPLGKAVILTGTSFTLNGTLYIPNGVSLIGTGEGVALYSKAAIALDMDFTATDGAR